jgi:pimeloyl-ACP methyl ester carboxylesterase
MPLPHAFDFAAWKRAAASTPSPPASSAPLAQRVAWLLGSGSGETSTGRAVGASSYAESGAVGTSWDYKASLMMRDTFARCETNKCVHNVTRLAFSFGAYITASLFVPCSDASCSEVATPLPVVIFLHGFSYQLGFTGIYDLYNGETNGGLIKAIVQQRGVAVLAFDLTGHGARQTEAHETFYRRFRGGASRLAAMVGAVQSALDFVRCSSTAAQALPECSTGDASVPYAVEFPVPALDERKVFVLGYSLGSVVALHAAAMLPQIAGVAAFSGWTPFRTNTGVATGGNALLYERHALIPRLGLFAGNETAIPYDYAELIAAIAPRPCLLHAPLRNRFAVPADVGAAAKAAAAAWGGNASAFTLSTPNTSSDFRDAEITAALHWIERFVQ